MTELVSLAVDGEVAVVRMNAPPLNLLDLTMRQELDRVIGLALADPAVQAVVLSATGPSFSAGRPLDELGSAETAPSVSDLCLKIETASKPVVAAVFGLVQGAAMSLILAAHHRIAAEATRFAFGEHAIGQIPGAGATQRLPRLTGAGAAIDMMLKGRPISAHQASAAGLIEATSPGSPMTFAMSHAQKLAAERRVPIRACDQTRGMTDRLAFLGQVAAARANPAWAKDRVARRLIDCVEAALLLPLDAALEMERSINEDLAARPEAQARLHLALAEQIAARHADLAGIRPLPVASVGILGAGGIGPDLAEAFLAAGFHVTLTEPLIDRLEFGVQHIVTALDLEVMHGAIAARERDTRLERLSGRTALDALSECDMVIDAAPDTQAAKRGGLGDLDSVARPGAVLVSHGSDQDIDALAAGTSRPSDVIGMRFSVPVGARRLVDLRPGSLTDPETTATALQILRRLGKIGLRAGQTGVPVGQRVWRAYRLAAEFLLEDGAGLEQIDAALRGFGFALGPFEEADILGLDIDAAWSARRKSALHPDARYVSLPETLCQLGQAGRRSGRGYYLYAPEGHRGAPNSEMETLLAEERLFHEITPRAFTDDGIVRVCLLAMICEGMRALQDGGALRPADIDLALVAGYGYPAGQGGPMYTADRIGLLPIHSDLQALAEDNPYFWTPVPLIEDMIRDGLRFSDLDARATGRAA